MSVLVKMLIGMALDMLEQAVISSETEWDDKIILPIIEDLRNGLNL